MTPTAIDRAAAPIGADPTAFISAETASSAALNDIRLGLGNIELWSQLALHDIRQRFRRSLIGPFWITLSMGTMIGTMGLVFSYLFHQDMAETLPYIAIGFVFWGLLTSLISEGSTVFISAEGTIRNVPLPLSVHFFRMLARNLLIWLFNMIIYIVILVLFGGFPGWSGLWFFPGFLLFLLNASWVAFVVGIVSTRFRDIPLLVFNVMQVIFFLTPVFWSPAVMSERPAFVDLNPAYHLLEVVRGPLLGQPPDATNWLVCGCTGLLGFLLSALLYRRAHSRIAYWI